MTSKSIKLEIIFKQSLYYSRFSYELNTFLGTLQNIENSHDFIYQHQKEYSKFALKSGYRDIPFSDREAIDLLNETMLSRIWDDFVLYLKQLILAAEMFRENLSQAHINRLDKLKFPEVKDKLNELKICPITQPQWQDCQKIKSIRDEATHSHKMKNMLISLHKQTAVNQQKHSRVSVETLFQIAHDLHKFGKKIDDEFLKKYPEFIMPIK